ncbi:MAG: hypothetical protein GY928_11800 [Colwellia sp.]|nr:hypothetical protein [Colwellia sp.]
MLSAIAYLAMSNLVHATQETICAVVKIEILQELTLERQGFEAIMKINNALEDRALTNIGVEVNFTDANGDLVVASSDPNHPDAQFFIRVSQLNNIDNVSGTGELPAATSATISWLIVPAPGSGGNIASGRLYYVGATFSYTLNDKDEEMVVAPDTIFVKPMPKLTLDYFLPSDVYADDPLTSEVEPIVPFTLGVRVRNNGNAAANAVKIDSAQPKIVENNQGLLINFEITDSFINEAAVNNSLLLDFGDIASNSSATGRWVMQTSLSGRFTEFDASFSHADELGGQLTSLIDSVNAHLLIHDVRVNLAGRDNVRDFLVDQGGVYTVFESDSVDTPVNNLSLSASFTEISADQYELSFPSDVGAVYVTLPDLFAGEKAIVQAVRTSDGAVLDSANVWQSKRYNKVLQQWQHSFHLFDTNTTGNYVIDFAVPVVGPVPPVMQYINDWSGPEGGQIGFLIEASDANGDGIAFTINPMPVGATLTELAPGKVRFNWLITPGQAGSYPITITATDGSFYANQQVMLTVFNKNDTDGDGLDDAWEILHFGDLSRDGTGDFDGDGISDLDEFLQGTNPTLVNSDDAELIDFELGTLTPLYWSHQGDVPWQITDSHVIDGVYSLSAGVISENQSSQIAISFYASGSPVRFALKGNSSAQDMLAFYIDDELQGQWSGENFSEQVAYALTPGKHTLTWRYLKDDVDNQAEEQIMIDNILLPIISDYDGDGIDDTWEYLYFDSLSHTLTADSDNDGLTDGQEYEQGTNPLAFDSDNDGMADGWEVAQGLNPLVNDSAGDINGDGQLNLVEYILATPDYPAESDVDNDGIPDIIEVRISSDPTRQENDNNVIIGTELKDSIIGSSLDDTIIALDSDDAVIGGLGNDVLYGGLGKDIFEFSLGDGHDTIKDVAGIDTIVFDDSVSTDMLTFHQQFEDGLYILQIKMNNAADQIDIEHWQKDAFDKFIQITFADGTVWNNSDIVSKVIVTDAPEAQISVPALISSELIRGRTRFPIGIHYSGQTSLSFAGLVASSSVSNQVQEDVDQVFDVQDTGLGVHYFEIPEGSKLARFSLTNDSIAENESDLDLYVYQCKAGDCSKLVGKSINLNSNEDVILVNPEVANNQDEGDYYVVYVYGRSTGNASETDYDLSVWLADKPEETTRIRSSRRAIAGRQNYVTIMTRGLTSNQVYMGAVTFYNDLGEAEGTSVLALYYEE